MEEAVYPHPPFLAEVDTDALAPGAHVLLGDPGPVGAAAFSASSSAFARLASADKEAKMN